MKAVYIRWTWANGRSDDDLFQATTPEFMWCERKKSLNSAAKLTTTPSETQAGALRTQIWVIRTKHPELTSGAWHGALPSLSAGVFLCRDKFSGVQSDRQPYGICGYVQKFKISIKYASTSASFTRHEFNATSHKVYATFLRLIRNTSRPRNLETWLGNHNTIARPVWSVQQLLRGEFRLDYPSLYRFLKDLRAP
jgi:hypothetical protein